MTPQQAENLHILADHMATKVERPLFMFSFFRCGTPACALGEATCVPALRAKGFANEEACYNEFHSGSRAKHVEEAHFGLTTAETHRLFGRGSVNAWNRNEVTPQEWALEARKVLAENGYSMDDGFAAFKAKILAPLPVTA